MNENNNGQTNDTPHKRRVRYKGTHPRAFHEKYKEANPEKYADTIEKVIRKGSTPAGMHISIMVDEILEVLKIQPGEQGLDATLGYGGHTSAMLAKLEGKGHMYALDVDPIEIVKTKKRLEDKGYGEDILTICQTNFANIDEVAKQAGKFDFVLADLGVSSMQIDNPERGFSYKVEGPLDLRLDPEHGQSASERLRSITKEEFIGMMVENSDEPYAEQIAKVVFQKMKRGVKFETTTELREAIEEALSKLPPAEYKEVVKKSCARVFQALRIEVNGEMEALKMALEQSLKMLRPGGRLSVISYHSLEDRLVKNFMRNGTFAAQAEKDFFGRSTTPWSVVTRKAVVPSDREIAENPRSRSAKMRAAEKL